MSQSSYFKSRPDLVTLRGVGRGKPVLPLSTLVRGVINFSSRTLKLQEKSVLEKGPKFCFRTNKVSVEEKISLIETSLNKNPILI